MAEKKTLLDLDRLPNLEEMQDFFKENDWSAVKIFTEPEHEAIFNMLVEKFVNALDETDKKMFYLRKAGCTQSEVSKILGFANNSTVSKRLKKMRELFREIPGY